MRNLLDFLIKYSSAFVFTFLFVISVILLVTAGSYHSSIWFTSANAVSSKFFQASRGVTDYFNLKTINASLHESNARLENEVLTLRDEVARYKAMVEDSVDYSETKRYDYILANVLNNNTSHPRNYFTLNKGSEDGIEAGMGVVDQNGIVGIVNVTGPHTSRIISILNISQHISVKFKDSGVVGSLTWKVSDPGSAYMEEVPRHTTFAIGDEIVTSGYSEAFPADIPVGKVMARIKTDNDNFYVLKIKLASDFENLSTVRVIKDNFREEIDSLKTFDIVTE